MGYFERLTPRSITAQITGIVVVSVLLGMVLTAAIVLFSGAAMPNDSPTAVALRIAHVTRFVRAARSLADADTILTAAQNAGVVVERVAISDLETLPNDAGLAFSSRELARQLESKRGIDVLERLRYQAGQALLDDRILSEPVQLADIEREKSS